MNQILQHIAVFLLFAGAVYFFYKKFFKTAKATTSDGKSCGSGGCGCH